jgi:hypothetical protein
MVMMMDEDGKEDGMRMVRRMIGEGLVYFVVCFRFMIY